MGKILRPGRKSIPLLALYNFQINWHPEDSCLSVLESLPQFVLAKVVQLPKASVCLTNIIQEEWREDDSRMWFVHIGERLQNAAQ